MKYFDMSHSLSRIWVHAIWATHNRVPGLSTTIQPIVFEMISDELSYMKCHVEIVNGMADHVHVLFLLSNKLSCMDVIQHVKGLVSHTINRKGIIAGRFAWQKGYAAYSVSESRVPHVANYIRFQKEHHQHMSFEAEHEQLGLLHKVQENREPDNFY